MYECVCISPYVSVCLYRSVSISLSLSVCLYRFVCACVTVYASGCISLYVSICVYQRVCISLFVSVCLCQFERRAQQITRVVTMWVRKCGIHQAVQQGSLSFIHHLGAFRSGRWVSVIMHSNIRRRRLRMRCKRRRLLLVLTI